VVSHLRAQRRGGRPRAVGGHLRRRGPRPPRGVAGTAPRGVVSFDGMVLRWSLGVVLVVAGLARADELWWVIEASASETGVTLAVHDPNSEDPSGLTEVSFPLAEPAWNLETAEKVTAASIHSGDLVYI